MKILVVCESYADFSRFLQQYFPYWRGDANVRSGGPFTEITAEPIYWKAATL